MKTEAIINLIGLMADKAGVSSNTFVVGGAVRDHLLSRPTKDVDIVIDAVKSGCTSDQFSDFIASRLPGDSSVATNQYGVAIITLAGCVNHMGHNLGGEVIEIANARTESYGGQSGKGYKPHMVKKATIEEDVVRREFTFNTLLWRLSDPSRNVIDITGRGVTDLRNGLLVTPRDPDTTFTDDPTRMVRAAKFMLRYDWDIDNDCLQSIRNNSDRIMDVPQNAIHSILTENVLIHGERSVQVLEHLGLLDVIGELFNDPVFRESQIGWFRTNNVADSFRMIRRGFPVPMPHVDTEWGKKGVEMIVNGSVPPEDSEAFWSALVQPGKAVQDKSFFPNLMKNVPNKGKASIAQRAQNCIRDILVNHPELIHDPAGVRHRVLEFMEK
jgi:tRNA nucleotidyltransferase/poly(A) polymerase